VKVGDMVRYMSRIILIIDISDDVWIDGIELGTTEMGKYKRRVLKPLN
jgi:hypothetical protein